ncbi:unnamed protein product [Auanema sp. JU1783]|nr:unnamed protein product [Auanema sp. JU1783]
MGLLKYFLITAVAAITLYCFFAEHPRSMEHIGKENKWYGPGKPKNDSETIENFRINFPEKLLEDLLARLKSSRVSHTPLEDANDFSYGFNAAYLNELRDYWIEEYDWRKEEKFLNTFNHFKTEIEGLMIHFIREKVSIDRLHLYDKVVPLLMVHGWPGNIYEFHKIISFLTDPKKYGIKSEFAFEVVIPSIPGYGWSDSPQKKGFSQVECARVFYKLMDKLGFKKFYLQGGDWGSVVTSNLARMYPDSIFGLHLNMVSVFPGTTVKSTIFEICASLWPKLMLSSTNLHNHNFISKFLSLIAESGYMHIQATKPDTIGTALNDSPIGLAAYILEKFSTWTNQDFMSMSDGGLTKKFKKEELITIIMIYWINGNIVNSQRFYKEYFSDARNVELAKVFLNVPTGHSSGLNELFDRTPVELSRMFMNITFYNEIPDMGHFACLEKPREIAEDIFAFVETIPV